MDNEEGPNQNPSDGEVNGKALENPLTDTNAAEETNGPVSSEEAIAAATDELQSQEPEAPAETENQPTGSATATAFLLKLMY